MHRPGALTRERCLMADNEPACLVDRVDHCIHVPGQQCAQVEHLAGDAILLRQLLRSLFQNKHLPAG